MSFILSRAFETKRGNIEIFGLKTLMMRVKKMEKSKIWLRNLKKLDWEARGINVVAAT